MKWFHSKMAQILFLSKKIKVNAVAFLKTRVTKTTEDDDKMLPRMLKYLCGAQKTSLVLDCTQGTALRVFAGAPHTIHDNANIHSGGDVKIFLPG